MRPLRDIADGRDDQITNIDQYAPNPTLTRTRKKSSPCLRNTSTILTAQRCFPIPNLDARKQETNVIYGRHDRSPGRIPNDTNINETDVVDGRRNRSPGRILNDRNINETDVIHGCRNRSPGRIPNGRNINDTNVMYGRRNRPPNN